MIFAYFMLMAALVVGTRVVSVVFTSGIVRSLQVSPEPSDNDAAYHRYGTRALLGVYPIPPGYLRVLCQILRISTLIMFAGFCGALYIAFSHAGDASVCVECQLDPSNKTLAFWLGYASAVVTLLGLHTAAAMVFRWDPRKSETGASLDKRRMRQAVTLIFTDELATEDRLARFFRDASRWAFLLGALSFIGWIVASRAGV
jgi:hypothetical protein